MLCCICKIMNTHEKHMCEILNLLFSPLTSFSPFFMDISSWDPYFLILSPAFPLQTHLPLTSLFTPSAEAAAFLQHWCQAHHILDLFLHLEQEAYISALSGLLWAVLAAQVRSDAKNRGKSERAGVVVLTAQRLNMRWGKEVATESLE